MSRPVTIGSLVYNIPDVGESNWGQNVSDALVAIAANISGGGFFTIVSVSSSPITVVSARTYLVDTTSARQLNLPTPAVGAYLLIKDVTGTAGTNNITLHRFIGTEKIDGTAADKTINANKAKVWLVSDGTDWFSLINQEVGYLDGVTSNIQTQINLKSPLASPTFTGTVNINGNSVLSRAQAANAGATAIIYDEGTNTITMRKGGSTFSGNMGLGNGASELISVGGHFGISTYGASQNLVLGTHNTAAITIEDGGATTLAAGLKVGDVAGYKQKTSFNIGDQAVYSFTPADAYAILMLYSANSGGSAIVAYRADASAFVNLLSGGASIEVTTGVLTGSTGTNGKITISASTAGAIYIENRSGATKGFSYMIVAQY